MIRGSGDQEARCTQADALAGGDWRGLSISRSRRHALAHGSMAPEPRPPRRGDQKGLGHPRARTYAIRGPSVEWPAGRTPRFASIASCTPAAALCLSLCSPGRWPSIPGSRYLL